MGLSFKQWFEATMDQTGAQAGVNMQNKQAIQKMGQNVEKALGQGQDVQAAAAEAGKDAAKQIATNAAQKGGDLSDLGTVTQGLQSLQSKAAPGALQSPKKMKK